MANYEVSCYTAEHSSVQQKLGIADAQFEPTHPNWLVLACFQFFVFTVQMAWIEELYKRINSNELAKDITEAEEMLEQHQQTKVHTLGNLHWLFLQLSHDCHGHCVTGTCLSQMLHTVTFHTQWRFTSTCHQIAPLHRVRSNAQPVRRHRAACDLILQCLCHCLYLSLGRNWCQSWTHTSSTGVWTSKCWVDQGLVHFQRRCYRHLRGMNVNNSIEVSKEWSIALILLYRVVYLLSLMSLYLTHYI